MTSAPSFRLLPVEATEAMIDAAMGPWVDLHPAFPGEKPEPTAGQVASTVYRAMVSAAPVLAEATDEMVIAASRAVVSEWRAMIIEILDRATPGEPERAFISPGNHRLIRAALNASLAIAAGQLGEKESGE